jgi:hypothetical protein
MKKGFPNISLGLNSCSMGSSWPWSRDTVPLSGEQKMIQKDAYLVLQFCSIWNFPLVLTDVIEDIEDYF